MTEDQEQKEITVKAPSKQVIDSQKKIEKATEIALEEERYSVLQLPKRTGKFIGYLSTCVGTCLLVLLLYASINAESNWALLSSNSSLPIIGVWILTGLTSIVVGFLLLGSE